MPKYRMPLMAVGLTAALMATAGAEPLAIADGLWASNQGECDPSDDSPTSRMLVMGREIRFYESICKIVGPVRSTGNRTTAQMRCEGEGNEWDNMLVIDRLDTTRVRSTLSDGQQIQLFLCGSKATAQKRSSDDCKKTAIAALKIERISGDRYALVNDCPQSIIAVLDVGALLGGCEHEKQSVPANGRNPSVFSKDKQPSLVAACYSGTAGCTDKDLARQYGVKCN